MAAPSKALPPVFSPHPAPQNQQTTNDPVAPRPAPATLDAASRYFTETGHIVSGTLLTYYRSVPHSSELFGLPLSEEFTQRLGDGNTYSVQYFERARLEEHPESATNPVQLGILTPLALHGRTFASVPAAKSTPDRLYFPETGHAIQGGFLEYWQTNGGISILGLPLSEELVESGITVQYFERARMEYRPDLQGTGYAIQLMPLGYEALKEGRFNIPMGTLISFEPPHLGEGHTALLEVAASSSLTVTGEYEGRPLLFAQMPGTDSKFTLVGAVPFADTGVRQVTVNLQNGDGGKRTVMRNIEIVHYPFPEEDLQFDAQTAALLDPSLTQPELTMLNQIFSGRTPTQYWHGLFRMPLDGKITITSDFATRRCYNCPPGTPPTTYHGGMDMAAALGTPVHAPADGKVVFSGKLNVRGNAIIIDHGLGVYSLFAHNSKLIATVGQIVHKDDIVSLSGSTGLSNGPHLHWELHVSGPPVEPLEWVHRPLP
ncbi:MAG: M23 family metallopeptidase [Chloroflexota bacterium]|nr:M23 family metallopeptidase [Chloroflexota bacterium]